MLRKRKLDIDDGVPDGPPPKQVAVGVNGGEHVGTVVSASAGINPYTGKVYSQTYWTIMQKRRTLPVWQAKPEFLELLTSSQTTILVGETGSGKTT